MELEKRMTSPLYSWGLLIISLIALALVAVFAPRVRQQQAGAVVPEVNLKLSREGYRTANMPARDFGSAENLMYVPLLVIPDQTPTVTVTPALIGNPAESPTSISTLPPSPTPISATRTPTPLPAPTIAPTPPPTPDGQTRSARVPILMYHYISVPPSDADIYRRDLSVTPDNFEQQLRYLAENGYTTITLQDLVYYLTLGEPLPEQPVILTFDDGYRDNFLHAYRLLRRYNSVGTFFLITSFIDKIRPEYLTWGQVRVMHRGGMEFGSHTYSHPDLHGQDLDYLVWQIVGSQEAIAERIEEPVRFFSYPAGSYDQQVIDLLHSAGFWAAVTTRQDNLHSSDALFELKRIRIRGNDTLEQFAAKLEYNWGENP